MSLYVGVNGTPKKLKKLFVGVNGSAKEVKTGYVGSSGVKKCYSSFNIDEELAKVNPVAALTSGKVTSAHIGRTVYLSNSAITCREWIIADVNHDGTSGTVDLFSKTALSNDNISFGTSKLYEGSNLDNYLESVAYNGFVTEIKSALNYMNVICNVGVKDGTDTIIQRHVVAPSLVELGNNLARHVQTDVRIVQEGSIYPIFSPACEPNSKSAFFRPDGLACYAWTRTRVRYARAYTEENNNSDVWFINSNNTGSGIGWAGVYNCLNTISAIARIRFAKA